MTVDSTAVTWSDTKAYRLTTGTTALPLLTMLILTSLFHASDVSQGVLWGGGWFILSFTALK